MDEMMLLIVVVAIYAVIGLISFVHYILWSLSLMQLASACGVKNAWLAWIPIATQYVLGATADCLEEKRGVSHNWGRVILYMAIACYALLSVFFVVMFAWLVLAVGAEAMYADVEDFLVLPLILLYVLYAVLLVVAIALSYITIISVFKIYDEIDSKKSIKYLLIHLLVPFGSVYCFFRCKNMIAPAMPAFVPAMPVPPNGNLAFGYENNLTCEASPVNFQETIINNEEKNDDQNNQQ